MEVGVGFLFSSEGMIDSEGAAFDTVFTVGPKEDSNAAGTTGAIGDGTEGFGAGMFALSLHGSVNS